MQSMLLACVPQSSQKIRSHLLEALPAQFLLTATHTKPHGLTHTLESLLLSPLP